MAQTQALPAKQNPAAKKVAIGLWAVFITYFLANFFMNAVNIAQPLTYSLTPEFGPPSYQHTLPADGTPIGDLAEICDWQAARQAQRFASRT